MNYQETPLVFTCENCRLVGIATMPETPSAIGVIIVVGGPQYRAGSHRQFTLLVRDLAQQGIASLRFDYRGMGDSEGDRRNFEAVDADIRAAADAFLSILPNIKQIVIWGLCDAASAALYYAHTDPRVVGLVLLNPWAHSETGADRARLKHYYVARLMQRDFWLNLLSGHVKLSASAREFLRAIWHFVTQQRHSSAPTKLEKGISYIDRMLIGMQLFTGNILLILSGNDLVAQEFEELLRTDKRWKNACDASNVEKQLLTDANHTFSTHVHRNQISTLTWRWLQKLLVTTYKHN